MMQNTCFNLILLIFLFTQMDLAEENKAEKNKRTPKPSIFNDIYFDVNRMNGIYRNNGICLHNAYKGDYGLEWPKGSGNCLIYAMGPWITAKINNEICVAAVKWDGTDFWPGQIIETDEADEYSKETYRWYELYEGYEKPDGFPDDYHSWPINQGAPTDYSGNPLLIGDRSAFCVYNDLRGDIVFLDGKLNLEIRQFVFGFKEDNFLKDSQFIKWQLVNKSGVDWDSTYFSIFVDPDIGKAFDDFIGCDTTRNLAFCYNSTNYDEVYGFSPPAVGIIFLQGPIISNPEKNVSLPDGTILYGKEMLTMSSFVNWRGGDSPSGDPYHPEQVWTYLHGQWMDYTPITEGGVGTNPDNPPTMYMFPGEPETGIGWIDNYADERTFLMTVGPFEMATWIDQDHDSLAEYGEPGVQDIIVAIIAYRGDNNLNSVTGLKLVADSAKQVYENNFYLKSVNIGMEYEQKPFEFILEQNYPNPFNPETVIRYVLPVNSHIDLSIYNILGQKVATLVSEEQQAGINQVRWDATEFAAGIYLYTMKADHRYIGTKKLILLK
jgi:hypothetical protein